MPIRTGKRLVLLTLALLWVYNLNSLYADNSNNNQQFNWLYPSSVGISGGFGVGYGFGEGTEYAKETLLETGSINTKITAKELLELDLQSQWLLNDNWSATINLKLHPVAFAVVGYNTSGKALEGRSYSYINLDFSILASYSKLLNYDNKVYVMAGPLLGIRLSEGKSIIISEDVKSTYTVPGEEMINATLGFMLSTGYLIPVGIGLLDFGFDICYHHSSVRGFLTDENIPINIVTPSISIGYVFDLGR